MPLLSLLPRPSFSPVPRVAPPGSRQATPEGLWLAAAGWGDGAAASWPEGGGRNALRARHLLLAEDEALVSLELSMALEDAGAEVRPTYSLGDTLAAARTEAFDAAVLDVNLAGHEVFPAARVLAERGVPLVFHTGHAKGSDIAADYPRSVTLAKPVATRRVVSAVSDAIERARPDA